MSSLNSRDALLYATCAFFFFCTVQSFFPFILVSCLFFLKHSLRFCPFSAFHQYTACLPLALAPFFTNVRSRWSALNCLGRSHLPLFWSSMHFCRFYMKVSTLSSEYCHPPCFRRRRHIYDFHRYHCDSILDHLVASEYFFVGDSTTYSTIFSSQLVMSMKDSCSPLTKVGLFPQFRVSKFCSCGHSVRTSPS